MHLPGVCLGADALRSPGFMRHVLGRRELALDEPEKVRNELQIELSGAAFQVVSDELNIALLAASEDTLCAAHRMDARTRLTRSSAAISR